MSLPEIPPSPARREPPTTGERPLMVLLVEDNPGDARLLRELFNELPAPRPVVTHAMTLGDARRLLAVSRCDVVLSDLDLPDSSGLATCDKLAAMAPDLPVVVLTGHDDPRLAKEAFAHGAQDYLVKGQSDARLLERVLRYALERARSARELRLAQTREAELKFLAVARCAQDGIVAGGGDGRIGFWNEGAQRLFGYDQESATRLLLVDLVAEADRQRLRQALAALQPTDTGLAAAPAVPLELVASAAGGRTFPAEVSLSVWTMGTTAGVVAVIRDITARRTMIDDLVRARDQAESAARAKSTFLATISHELRTPLNGIIGMNYLLCETELSPTQREYAETSQQCSQTLLDLVSSVLDFARMESGNLAIDSLPLNLRAIVDDCLSQAAMAAQHKPLELAAHVAGDLPNQLVGDPARLHQLLGALLDNAVKFSERGEILVEAVVVASGPQSVRVRIRVRDTGIGIPSDLQQRLFQPFTQGDSSHTRRFAGTGLGLSICRRLVELMGGEIGLASAPGHGTTVTVVLPLRVPEHATAPLAKPALASTRVLVADAHPDTRHAVVQALSGEGAKVEEASDGQVALARLEAAVANNKPFHLLIADNELPLMPGVVLVGAARALPGNQGLGSVLLARLGARPSDAMLQSRGITVCLTKPAGHAQIVRAAITAHRARTSDAGGARPAPLGPPRVLVAEDDQINRRYLVKVLERLRCIVDIALDGHEAVTLTASRDYALVLMDWLMPGMDGFAATAAIRRRDRDKARIPIVALTANAMPGDRERCLAAGMDDYLPKPVRMSDLQALLERWYGPLPQAGEEKQLPGGSK